MTKVDFRRPRVRFTFGYYQPTSYISRDEKADIWELLDGIVDAYFRCSEVHVDVAQDISNIRRVFDRRYDVHVRGVR
jgi:hypothetical protein